MRRRKATSHLKECRALLLAACALLLAACGPRAPQIDHGMVTGKHFDPASTGFMPSTVCSGKPLICSTIMIPYDNPPHYYLHLKNKDAEGEREVTDREYVKYQVGQGYP